MTLILPLLGLAGATALVTLVVLIGKGPTVVLAVALASVVAADRLTRDPIEVLQRNPDRGQGERT